MQGDRGQVRHCPTNWSSTLAAWCPCDPLLLVVSLGHSCVAHGKEMLEAMAREQLSGALHHSAACRLIADTFLAVVADLGQAAESDEMHFVAHRVRMRPPGRKTTTARTLSTSAE